MLLGIVKESFPGERRVALTPPSLPQIGSANLEVLVEPGSGVEAGFSDAEYAEKGAKLADRKTVLERADILLQVRTAGANLARFRADLPHHKRGQVIIGMVEPLAEPQAAKELAGTGATIFALELMPRLTRVQSMDVLSSMATIAGYKAVLLAASRLSKIFPMLITGAGTLNAARVFVIGAGVAGLQAIATARRLGAMVEAYDVRSSVREQVQSLGGKYVDFGLKSAGAEDRDGYAKAEHEDFYRQQREAMAKVVGASDVVISTAAIPGRRAPVLVTKDMVARMHPGSVVIDVAAERGGNCELTRPGEEVQSGGVVILGPLNLASTVPHDASMMYARNVVAFARQLFDSTGNLNLHLTDDVLRATLIAQDGALVHSQVKELAGV